MDSQLTDASSVSRDNEQFVLAAPDKTIVCSLETTANPSPVEGSLPAAWKPTRHVALIFMVQYTICFVVALDATILTTTLPELARSLEADATKAFWIATSYLLASAVFQPPIASLSDIFGRRAMYFGTVMCFTIGTVVCCACNNIAGMLAGRSVQGIGGGGIFTLNLIILSDLVPLRQRAQYQGYFQLVFALGSNIAPIIGGAIVQHTTWRWLFLINLPFCALGLAAVPFILRYERPAATFQSRILSIDWIGIASFIISVTVFLVGMTWAGIQYSWRSAATLCPLLLGLAGLGGVIMWEWFGAKKPFLRLSLFENRSAIATYVCTVVMAFLIYGTLYYIVLWLIVVKDLSNVLAGVAALPLCLTMVPTSGVVGTVISKSGHYLWAIRLGWLTTTLGTGLLVLLHTNSSPGAYVPIFAVCGIGTGLLMISLSAASQATSHARDAAYASSMYAFMRSLGLCFGVSIGGTAFQNFLARRLAEQSLPTDIARNAEAFAVVLRAMPASEEKTAILEAYAWAFRMLFAVLTGISGVGVVIALAVGQYSLDKELESEHVLRKEAGSGGRGNVKLESDLELVAERGRD